MHDMVRPLPTQLFLTAHSPLPPPYHQMQSCTALLSYNLAACVLQTICSSNNNSVIISCFWKQLWAVAASGPHKANGTVFKEHKTHWKSSTSVVNTWKESFTFNRPWGLTGLWDVEVATFSRQSAHKWRWGCQPYEPAAIYPSGRSLVLFSVKSVRPQYALDLLRP
jgi:hypothetical protein